MTDVERGEKRAGGCFVRLLLPAHAPFETADHLSLSHDHARDNDKHTAKNRSLYKIGEQRDVNNYRINNSYYSNIW